MSPIPFASFRTSRLAAFTGASLAGLTLCGQGIAATPDALQPVAITITGKECEPNAVTVPEGKTTFKDRKSVV